MRGVHTAMKVVASNRTLNVTAVPLKVAEKTGLERPVGEACYKERKRESKDAAQGSRHSVRFC